jgi:hypothetical protein
MPAMTATCVRSSSICTTATNGNDVRSELALPRQRIEAANLAAAGIRAVIPWEAMRTIASALGGDAISQHRGGNVVYFQPRAHRLASEIDYIRVPVVPLDERPTCGAEWVLLEFSPHRFSRRHSLPSMQSPPNSCSPCPHSCFCGRG